MKIVEVSRTKEFASTFLQDPILRMAVNAVLDAAPEAEIQRWIPVTERLPEVNGRYLCNVKSFAFPGCFYQAILQYDKHGFREGNIYTDDVTNWMPLPTPPEVVV